MLGHAGGESGVVGCFGEGGTGPVRPASDWLVLCGRIGEYFTANGVNVTWGEASQNVTAATMWVPNSTAWSINGGQGSHSDWAVSEIAVWDALLSDAEVDAALPP